MPTLEWIGKEKVVNHHLDVPYRVLERKYSYDESGQHDEDNGSENMIIHGDNLDALKALLPRFEGRVKCIYIDPPYNTGNEKWVYNDNVNDPRILKWLGQVVGAEGEDLSRHDKWLCMMYPRLKLLREFLRDDGVIFVSIDENEHRYLEILMDEDIKMDDVNIKEISFVLRVVTELDIKEEDIGIEVNSKGYITKIIVAVSDKTKAEKISELINKKCGPKT